MDKNKSKTTFKSISENRIRKNINFGKHFPKIIYEGKIGISEGLEETFGGEEKNSGNRPLKSVSEPAGFKLVGFRASLFFLTLAL
jgi:hypothetical protein